MGPTNHKSFDDNSNDDDGDELMSTIFMSRRWRYKLYELPPNIRQLKGTSCVRGTIGVSVPALPEIISFSTRGATLKLLRVPFLSSVPREATVSERRPTGTSTFPFSVNERLSGKRKNRPEDHVFNGGS